MTPDNIESDYTRGYKQGRFDAEMEATQDRLAISTALVEAGDAKIKPVYDQIETAEDAREYKQAVIYNQAIQDYQNIIKKLLESKN